MTSRAGPPVASAGQGRWLFVAAVGALVAGAGLLGVASLALAGQQASPPPGEVGRPFASAPPKRDPTPLPAPSEAALTEPAEPRGDGSTVDTAWADALAAELGIPQTAFRAYAAASLAVAEEYQGCGLGWNTLAGIGFVESHHGTIGGATPDPDGRASPPIVGIPLDGSNSARIPDTDAGALDGDTRWDRAVGPMQFIPGTWARWGSDGDGDGIADPQQIDDAVYSAARYLCASGGDLRKPANWIAAINAYNRSVSYNNQVADAADRYAKRAERFRDA